jgi:hypothetical protein
MTIGPSMTPSTEPPNFTPAVVINLVAIVATS